MVAGEHPADTARPGENPLHGDKTFFFRRDGQLGIVDVEPGLKKPAGTGPVTAVTGLTGPDRFRYGAVRNRPKFKF